MGCRLLKIQPGFVASLMAQGVNAVEPENVPKDLEILSARMNFSGHPLIELLVRSAEFDGSDAQTLDTAVDWTATFRRRPPDRELAITIVEKVVEHESCAHCEALADRLLKEIEAERLGKAS